MEDEKKPGCIASVYALGALLIFMMKYFSWEQPFWESLLGAIIWPLTLALVAYEHWLEHYRE